MDDAFGSRPGERGRKLGAQLRWRLELAIVEKIRAKRPVVCTRDMAGLGIDGLDFTSIALGGTSIEDAIPAGGDARYQCIGIDCCDHRLTNDGDSSRARRRSIGRNFVAPTEPAPKTAIEYRRPAMPDPLCEPPQTCRIHAVAVVVSDERGMRSQPCFREASRKRCAIGKRVAPMKASVRTARRSGKIVIQVQKVGAGDVSLRIGTASVVAVA